MELPKYYGFYVPVLRALEDGKVHTLKEIREYIIKLLNLSKEDVSKMLPSGNQAIYDNRIGWARTYLKKAGLIISEKKGYFKITEEGSRLLKSGVDITDDLLAEHYPEFYYFKYGNKKIKDSEVYAEDMVVETPQETFERMYNVINKNLSDDLLMEIMNNSPLFFERLVVDLMCAMGYGDGFVTKSSNDFGIDGVINEDKLGFNVIYIQAKRWDIDKVIGRPEIQKFAGAMMGPPRIEKGLFITTAKFSDNAREYAKAQHIILIDGEKLAELMIEYGVGVSVQYTYNIKKIDSDYFEG